MSRVRRLVVLTVGLVLLDGISGSGTAEGAAGGGGAEITFPVPDFASLDPTEVSQATEALIRRRVDPEPGHAGDEINRAVEVIMQRRSDLVGELLRQFTAPGATPKVKGCTAYLLGELRAPEAAGPLVGEIDIVACSELLTRIPRWGPHPVAQALRKIGRPAACEVRKHLPRETNEFRRELMCSVLSGVGGYDEGLKTVRELLAEARGEQEKANLRAAMKYFLPPYGKASPPRVRFAPAALGGACAGSFALGLAAMALLSRLRRRRKA